MKNIKAYLLLGGCINLFILLSYCVIDLMIHGNRKQPQFMEVWLSIALLLIFIPLGLTLIKHRKEFVQIINDIIN